jgi:hypothetical protein
VNYNTVRQLVNGARNFESDTPLNRLMAVNLAMATGVDPKFRYDHETLVDIWGRPFTAQTYLEWSSRKVIPKILTTGQTPVKGGRREELPSLLEEMRIQVGKLLDEILAVAKAQGPACETMAFQLVKSQLVRVSEDLGVLPSLQSRAKLRDYLVVIDGGDWYHNGLLRTVHVEEDWQAKNPLISLEGVNVPDDSMPADKRERAAYLSEIRGVLDTL